MPFCSRCGTALEGSSKFCVKCGNPLSLGEVSVSGANLVRSGPLIEDRPFAKEEFSNLRSFGTDKKEWAMAVGFVNLLLGGFALVVPAEDFGSDGAQVLGAMTLGLGLIGVSLGIVSRKSRSLAAKAVSAGVVRDTQGVVQGSSLKVMKVSLEAGSLEIPKNMDRDIMGTLSGVGNRVRLVFSRPANLLGRDKVILLSINGRPLTKPVQCTYLGDSS